MAYLGGTYVTTQAIGNREDLTDAIYNIDPTDHPFMNMIAGREKVKATYHEWQTDHIGAAAANSVVEGNDATFSTAAPTVRLGNRTQISTKTVIVSGTQDVVDKAGRDSEYRYQVAKQMKALKRDMETGLTGNQASSAGTTAIPRRLGSLEAWFSTNVQKGASSDATATGFSSNNVVAAGDESASGLLTLTESMLKTAMKTAWSAGGSPKYAMCGPYNKTRISEFAGIATLYRDTGTSMKQASIMGAADIYVSDFGQVKVIPNRFSRDRTITVLDPDFWSIGFLRPLKEEPLAKTGDARKGQLIVEYTLVSKNEAASAKIADLLTTGSYTV